MAVGQAGLGQELGGILKAEGANSTQMVEAAALLLQAGVKIDTAEFLGADPGPAKTGQTLAAVAAAGGKTDQTRGLPAGRDFVNEA